LGALNDRQQTCWKHKHIRSTVFYFTTTEGALDVAESLLQNLPALNVEQQSRKTGSCHPTPSANDPPSKSQGSSLGFDWAIAQREFFYFLALHGPGQQTANPRGFTEVLTLLKPAALRFSSSSERHTPRLTLSEVLLTLHAEHNSGFLRKNSHRATCPAMYSLAYTAE
ncbi:hypothetical protein AMECASPLE_023622, partial [Ameca splendens]